MLPSSSHLFPFSLTVFSLVVFITAEDAEHEKPFSDEQIISIPK